MLKGMGSVYLCILCIHEIGPCVCLSPYTIYILVGTLLLPSSHFDAALLNCWIFVAYTPWHTYSDTDFSVLMNEPWLIWMLLVTVGTADVLVPRTCNDTHTHLHTHTHYSHLAACSLAYILSPVFPKATHPTYHNALLPPTQGSICHCWCLTISNFLLLCLKSSLTDSEHCK